MKKVLIGLLLGIVVTSLVAAPAFAGGAYKYLFVSDDYSKLVEWGYTGDGAILVNNAGFTVWRYNDGSKEAAEGYWKSVFKMKLGDDMVVGWPEWYSTSYTEEDLSEALPYPEEFAGMTLWVKHYPTDAIPKFKNTTD